MKRTALLAIALVLGLALAAPSAALDNQGRGNARGQGAKPGKPDNPGENKAADSARKRDNDPGVVVVDRDGHARVIREFRGTGSLPPGLAKRQSLPPGLRRQLVERGELPPGLEKYRVDVPEPWMARLPAIPANHSRYFVGDDLIVVDTRTNRIVAVMRDVLR